MSVGEPTLAGNNGAANTDQAVNSGGAAKTGEAGSTNEGGAEQSGVAGPGGHGPAAMGVGLRPADPGDLTESQSSGSAAFAAALACLPGAGPATLVALLQDWTPEEAWRRIRAGRLVRPGPDRRAAGQLGLGLDRSASPQGKGSAPESAMDYRATRDLDRDHLWQDAARRLDPSGWWAEYEARGIGVTWVGDSSYPAALVDDPQPAGVLFWTGSLWLLERPCVAIVGTRRATPDGRSIAFEMGRDLAAVGICVVSGLALGIDGAAHTGALSGLSDNGPGPGDGTSGGVGFSTPPAGIAASGVDVPYPRCHRWLWDRVARSGVMLSETPPGRPAQAWRFPARNRIIAALSRMVVVVESHEAGGSLITAEAAILRGIDVRAVPGPVRSSASAGTNQLLHDGPAPVRNAQDVLDGLGIFLLAAPDDRTPQEWRPPGDGLDVRSADPGDPRCHALAPLLLQPAR